MVLWRKAGGGDLIRAGDGGLAGSLDCCCGGPCPCCYNYVDVTLPTFTFFNPLDACCGGILPNTYHIPFTGIGDYSIGDTYCQYFLDSGIDQSGCTILNIEVRARNAPFGTIEVLIRTVGGLIHLFQAAGWDGCTLVVTVPSAFSGQCFANSSAQVVFGGGCVSG